MTKCYNLFMNKRYNNVKAVIFDMDGVIIDSERLWKKSFKMANKQLGVHVSEKFRKTCAGIPFNVNMARLQNIMPEIDAQQYFLLAKKIHRQKIKNNELKIKDGFFELINHLKKNNLKIALCTGSSLAHVEFVFNTLNISLKDFFDYIVSGDKVLIGKPDPEPYIKACEGINENPKNCLVLEDSINGINSAYDAGTIPVMVLDIIKPDKTTKTKCHKIVKSLKKVIKLI